MIRGKSQLLLALPCDHLLIFQHLCVVALCPHQKARTQDSAKAFMEGMYGGGAHSYTDHQGKSGIIGHDRAVNCTKHAHSKSYTIRARPKQKDPLLRFFDMCPAYDAYVKEIDGSFLVSSSGRLQND